jgi:hypothetical protein
MPPAWRRHLNKDRKRCSMIQCVTERRGFFMAEWVASAKVLWQFEGHQCARNGMSRWEVGKGWDWSKGWQGKWYRILKTDVMCLFFFGTTGVWTQGFMLARQVLYCLSHTSSPRLIIRLWLYSSISIHANNILWSNSLFYYSSWSPSPLGTIRMGFMIIFSYMRMKYFQRFTPASTFTLIGAVTQAVGEKLD